MQHKKTLNGKVMDTSGNWLNDARVCLKNSRLETTTDPNGNFSFDLAEEAIVDSLEVVKEGYLSKVVEITPADLDVTVELTPNPVAADCINISVQMTMAARMDNYFSDLKEKAGYGTTSPDIPAELFAEIINDRIRLPLADETGAVDFYLYIPESVKKVKAVFYLSQHGIGNVEHPVLRAFAEEESVALIGLIGNPVQRGFFPASLIDEYVSRLAELSGHSELSEVPFMTFGHSNGTGFSGCLPSQRPERAIAWISYHAGTCQYLQFPNTEKVPALVMCGAIDEWFTKYRQDKAFTNMRSKRNAAMCMMLEGSVGHGPVNETETWQFITRYCKAAMRIRLNEDGTLNDIDLITGWLGDIYDLEKGGQQLLKVARYDEYTGDKSTANWLPDEEFAKVWQTYGNTEPELETAE